MTAPKKTLPSTDQERETAIRDVIDVCENELPAHLSSSWGHFRARIDTLLPAPKRRKRVLRHLSMRHQRTLHDSNATEAAFANAWVHENKGNLLGLLLNPDTTNRPPPLLSQRDATVAATVVQWLGSNVGMCFLRDVLERPEFAPMVRMLHAHHERRGNR